MKKISKVVSLGATYYYMEIWLTTLKDNLVDPSSERYDWIKKNINLYPEIKIIHSVDGRNKDLVKLALKESGLNLYQLGFRTYGTLAVFLTKFLAWKKQVKDNIPYVCLIEDDIELNEAFWPFLESKKHLLEDPSINIVRLGDWGEAYLTSLSSAKRLIEKIQKDGIWRNIDEQLWECGESVVNKSIGGGQSGVHYENRWVNGVWEHTGYQENIFKLLKQTNEGLPLNTQLIDQELSESYFAGGPFDMRKREIQDILESVTSPSNYLTFGLGSSAIILLKNLKENESLTSYEWGESYLSCLKYKNSFNITDEKFMINDLSKNDPSLLEDFIKKWGKYDEEIPNKILYDLIAIDYKKYDTYILDGFLRGLTTFLALNNNSKAEVFIHDASRDWYDWLKVIFNVEHISQDIIKIFNKK